MTKMPRKPIRVPEIFQPEDITFIIDSIKKLSYQNNCWGDWMRVRDACIIALMYHCALRPTECLSLRFDDIDSELRLRIRPETNKMRSGRLVPIPNSVMPYLKKYLGFSKLHFWQGSPYIFPSFENKQRPLSAGRWKGRFREILKAAGVWRPPLNSTVPPLRSYTLRISKATHILEKTHDLRAVQAILGHKKLESTLTYVKLTSKYQEWLRQAMDE